MPEAAPLPNDPAARTTDGTLKDVSPPPTTETTTPSPEPTTEAKPPVTEPKSEGTTLLTKPDDAPAGAPEKYEDFKVPADIGTEYELDPGVIAEATPLFKEMNLTQDQAQKLVDFYVKQSAAQANAPMEQVRQLREEWQSQVKADPEVGRDLRQTKVTIDRALSLLGDQKLVGDFKAAMDLTGAGDNPAFVKAFYKLSKLVTEGQHVNGGGPSPAGQTNSGRVPQKSLAERMYPNNPN